jgi:hypothetical protein
VIAYPTCSQSLRLYRSDVFRSIPR